MHPILEVLILAGVFFGWGLTRGSVICATICAPAFATRAVDKGYSVRQGIAAAIYFNIPRIIILTVLGIVIGYAAYSLSSSVEENVEPYEEATRWLRMFGYMALGIVVLILGLRMLVKNFDELEDIKEGKIPDCRESCRENCSAHTGTGASAACRDMDKTEPVKKKTSLMKDFRDMMGKLEPGDRKLFFTSGGLMGLACTSELFFGTLFTGGGMAILQDSPLAAAAVGGIIMLAFSIGATIPVVLVMVAAVSAARKTTDAVRLNRMKIGGSVIAVIMGIALILVSLA